MIECVLGFWGKRVPQQWPIKIAGSDAATLTTPPPGAAVNLEVHDSLSRPIGGAAFFSKCPSEEEEEDDDDDECQTKRARV